MLPLRQIIKRDNGIVASLYTAVRGVILAIQGDLRIGAAIDVDGNGVVVLLCGYW